LRNVDGGLKVMGDFEISGGRLIKYRGHEAVVVIPEGVTAIGNEAFSDCHFLTSIKIPEGVTAIGNEAFSGCQSLKSITIPESVTCFGDNAFKGCNCLTDKRGLFIVRGVVHYLRKDGIMHSASARV